MGGPTRSRDRACRSLHAPQSARPRRRVARFNRRRAFLRSAPRPGRAETTPRDPRQSELPCAVSMSRRLLAHVGRLDDAREIVGRLRAITSVVIPDVSFIRNAEHRELWLSGLRLAAGEKT